MSAPKKKRGPYMLKKFKLNNVDHDDKSHEETHVHVIEKDTIPTTFNEVPAKVLKKAVIAPSSRICVEINNSESMVHVPDENEKRDIYTPSVMDTFDTPKTENMVNTVIINERTQFEYTETDISNSDPTLEELDLEEQEIYQSADKEFADEEETAVIIDPVVETYVEEIPKILLNECTTDNQNSESNCPLYAGCSKTLGLLLLMICSLSIRFKLSDEAISFIIVLIKMILPEDNIMIKSVYALKDYLKKFVSFPTIHYLCSVCGTHVPKDTKKCVNKHCLKDLTLPGSIGYFIQHSVIAQLQLMSKRSSFLDKVRLYRFQHYANNTQNKYTDIFDGSNYKNSFETGFLNDPNSVSFSLNTDGVQIFKSSKLSMWPVFMIINELPPSERKLKENIIYYGLWIAEKKTQMWSFLKPLHEELCKLEDGVELQDFKGENFIMRGTLLNCVCDLPARCLVSNSMQFNGKFGCWFCLQPGETYTTNKGGHVHVFPYSKDDPKGPARTVQNLQADVNEVVTKIQANEKQFAVHGIKGPFWFMFLKHFNVIHGFVIDYMHGVCAGVMKLMLTLWFDKQHKHEKYSVFTQRAIVNARLKSIQPNLQITRPPRSLDDMNHWKSAEYRNFLFLWGLPVLNDIIPHEYYMHFCLLVRGIYNLSRENVSHQEVENAERCLLLFVENFPKLYSLRYMTMNCHQLLHISDCVRANGPIFANNCFVFEDLNGYIIKHIHGTTGIEMQLINAITKMQALPTLQELYVEKKSADEALLNDILRPNFIYNGQCVEEGVIVLGQTYKKTLVKEEYSAISDLLGTCSPELNVTEYRKVFLTKIYSKVYGDAYGRLQRRNQSTVKYHDVSDIVHFGNVNTFIQIENYDGNILNIALIHPFTTLLPYSNQQSCHKVQSQFTEVVAVPIRNILKVCTVVKSGIVVFVVEFPNKYEKD